MLTDIRPGPDASRYLLGFDLRRRPHLEADVLVVGGGVAGLCAAIAAADEGKEVLVLAKGSMTDSNTAWAQGGVAVVLGNDEREPLDNVELHVRDTLAAGAGLCEEGVVRDILGAAAESIELLRKHGCLFDRSEQGALALTREGGHSARRILHANGDSTGAEIVRSLAAAAAAHPRITVIENAFAVDLLSDDESRIVGVIYHRREELVAALAGSTILATGGCGRVWRESTNPPVATGDGLAMAYRAGAELADLEFMQFHPTTLYIAGGARLLITEAMRGEGAVLKNHEGERFMPRYHPDAELAPRDVVTRAIIAEIRRTGFPHVWLDATHLGAEFLRGRFPTIFQACAKLGIDITTAWMPVHPSAHYHCGGIITDQRGATSLGGLWASGEVACTGLHGANRLASNSILEGLVMGMRSGIDAGRAGKPPGRVRISSPKPEPTPEGLDVPDLVRSLRALMWRQVGIERTASELAVARRSLAFWLSHQARGDFRDRSGWELQNQLLVGSLVASSAERRTASVGTHTRSDSQGAVDPRHLGFVRKA
ncbi:MAG: L-aspartate oxidase [Planctomycetes bacterium]|nr:L-aspartate oxidase [Planctomycetota bacterium]